jgi:hypothetical protein
MHPILEEIYATQTVTDGTSTYSALNPKNGRPTYMDAYGVSSLFICEALAMLPHEATHIVMDPLQGRQWRNIGLRNLRAAGYSDRISFFEEPSEYCLPRLVQQGTRVQFALVDGIHTFDQCALEFYYIDRLLPVGGVIVFDDVRWRAVRRALRYVLSHGTYKVKDHTGAPLANRTTVYGRVRRAVGRVEAARRLLNRDLLVPDWELGITGSCVALQKVSEQSPTYGDDRSFAEF